MVSLATQQPNPIFEILEKSQHFTKTNQTQSNAPQKNLPSTMSKNQTQEPPRKPPINHVYKSNPRTTKKTSHWSTNINNILKNPTPWH